MLQKPDYSYCCKYQIDFCCTNPKQQNDATYPLMAKISLFGKTIRDIHNTLEWCNSVLILFTDKSGRDPVLKDAKVLFIVGKI